MTDLPCEDESAGLSEYTDAVVDAIGDRAGLLVVAQSFGGLTGPLVCDRVAVELLVLVAGMIPSPGEPPQDWWANTGYEPAKREQTERDGSGADGEDYVIATYYHEFPRSCGRSADKGAASVQHSDAEAVAARSVSRRAAPDPALSRRCSR